MLASAARSAASRDTVRMVPSAGFITALIGGGDALVTGRRQSRRRPWSPCPSGLSGDAAEQQGQNDAGVAPGAAQQGGGGDRGRLPHGVRAASRASAVAAAPMVRLMLVPVSPSGTGNTFKSLMDCFSAWIAAAP